MSKNYRQTISDELARLIEQKRGVLTIQEFTTLALAQFVGAGPCAPQPPAPAAAPVPQPEGMLSFD